MRTGELISVREYLATSDDPGCDYVDGVLVERNKAYRCTPDGMHEVKELRTKEPATVVPLRGLRSLR